MDKLDIPRGENIFFVGGPPRAGTTLLQRILDSHPLVFGGPEFDRIPDVVKLREQLLLSVNSGRIHSFISKSDIDKSIARLIEDLLYPAMLKNKKSFISEKTPFNVLVFNELSEICPSAKFIFVIRDPFSIISSLKQVRINYIRKFGRRPDVFTRSLHSSVRFTLQCVDAGAAFMKSSPTRVKLVKYEDLVSTPHDVTQSLCRFLGIRWDERMLSPNKNSTANVDGVGVDDVWYSKGTYFRDITSGENMKWVSVLTEYEKAVVKNAFGRHPFLIEQGYDTAKLGISRHRERLAALSLRTTAQLEKSVGSARALIGRRVSAALSRFC